MMAAELWVSFAVFAIAAFVLWAPAIARRAVRDDARPLLAITAAIGAAAFVTQGAVAYVLLAVATALQALTLERDAPGLRPARIALGLSALLALVAAAALASGAEEVAFVASMAAVAVRVGMIPLHTGVAALCDRSAHRQSEQLAVSAVLVFAHLRFADATTLAFDAAPAIVRFGAAVTLLPGLLALVQRELRGFFRAATLVHGGMIVGSLGAAGRGHDAAALMIVLTTAIAVGGLGLMVSALEARTGPAQLAGPGGRVQALPRLAAAFAVFGAAGVAMPGTAGYIADDLMLHALWQESVVATIMMILGSATLAVSTLRTYAGVFLGPAVPTLAPDLLRRERVVVTLLIVLLLLLGVVPGYLLTPADAMLNARGGS